MNYYFAPMEGITDYIYRQIVWKHFPYADKLYAPFIQPNEKPVIVPKEYNEICVPIPSDGPYEYWEEETMTGKGLLSMKHVAVACGIGQLGKSSLLLNPEYGNRLTLGAILTNVDFESDPVCKNICIPGCTKCLDSCPVLAIQEKSVTQKKCRQNTYGNTARGYDTVDCNKCRSECPMRDGIL